MPVFENLKNFIRHGKQAYGDGASTGSSSHVTSSETANTLHSTFSASSARGHLDDEEEVRSPQSSKKNYYNDAAKKIVEEEHLQKSRMPKYPGLERFVLLEKLGDGAFSIVYKARDTSSNEHVAVKVIRKQDLSTSQNVDRHLGEAAKREQAFAQRSSILKEVAIMRQLKHKNVVKLIDFSESPDHYFIVLELIPGGELFHQIVRLTYFSEDLSRHVIIQVAEAIRYLHEEAGVVHRDIKPENLLFYPSEYVPSTVKSIRKGEDENKEDEGEFVPGVGAGGIGQIKLADFGLSKIIWDNKTMTPCGTVGYTAPEIVKDERYSKSVDMWALGCVLYTVLCGFPPFYDESIEVLTEKVAKGQYTFLSPWWDEISKSAKDLVSHLLTVDPERRYSIDQFLNHPWITQKDEPTAPAFDAPMRTMQQPSAPAEAKVHTGEFEGMPELVHAQEPILHDSAERRLQQALESSDKGFLSPAAVTLKEVFDVSNAVHRMEEEAHRNKRRGGVFLDPSPVPLEEDELAEEEHDIQRGFERVSMNNSSKPAQPMAIPRKARAAGGNTSGGLFELHLEGATLLERRKKHHPAPQAV